MELTSGYRRIFSAAPIYDAAQRIIGADRFVRVVTGQHVRAAATDCVVDIGCGTAEIRRSLDVAEYIGIEPNESYANTAASRLATPDRVVHSGVDDPDLAAQLPTSCDIVTLIGVLHHLDDRIAHQALDLAKRLIGNHGRVVSADPTLVAGQHRVSRALVERDRGQNVRSPDDVEALFAIHFGSVAVTLHDDLLRVPYHHVVVEAAA